jgi:hypothetical protein
MGRLDGVMGRLEGVMGRQNVEGKTGWEGVMGGVMGRGDGKAKR